MSSENIYSNLMSIALDEAKLALNRNDLPIGAVLAIDDLIIGKDSNKNAQMETRIMHAETLLLFQHSRRVRSAQKSGGKISLVTTLEPCLLCLGAATLSRVTEIIYACPDPHGGAAKLDPKSINSSGFYERKWPRIIQGPYCLESYNMLLKYMRQNPDYENVVKTFEEMRKNLGES